MTPTSEELPEGEEKSRKVRRLFDTISGRYDLVNRVMTLGMDIGWRRRAVRELRLPGEALVVDLACGTGDLCRELVRRGYRTVGFDFSHGMLAYARGSNSLVEADILRLPLTDGSVDGATCGFALRNVVSLPELFAEVARVVRPEGRIALLETSEPDVAVLRAGHALYFRRVVPLIGGLLSSREAYSYLPRSVAYLPPATEMVRMLSEAGFREVERRQLSGGVVQAADRDPDRRNTMKAGASFAFQQERLGRSFDLLAAYPGHGGFLLERDGVGVAAAGSGGIDLGVAPGDGAGILELDRAVLATLRSLAGDVMPLAVGALGFDPNAGGHLHVPRTAVRRWDDGTTRRLRLANDEADVSPLATTPVVEGSPRKAFAEVEMRELPSPDVYADAVSRAVSEIRDGALRKVVLARTIAVDAGHELDPRRLLHHLRAVEPHAFSFAVRVAGERGVRASLVGASPELLVSRRGLEIRSNPLAGSASRSGDPEVDRENARALADSAKDHEEHAIVVDAMAETLGPFCQELAWDPAPVLHETANVWHLSTRFRGILREAAPSVLELVAALHPTPAVCGAPRAEALELIGELEPFDRGRYAGAVGWIDAAGDGDWVIALRCAELEGERAMLYAGAGIVADSVPEREVDETDRKFRAFLDALRWG